jgi:hypothetical protein
MKKFLLIALFLTEFLLNAYAMDSLSDKIQFASIEKAKALLTTEDDFTDSWSQFDIDSRMHRRNSTKEELFAFIAKQAKAWTTREEQRISAIVKDIERQIEKNGYKLDFPDEIYFVKTTTLEEGRALGYTRAYYVVLRDDILKKSEYDLKELIAHELFHILTRYKPEFRKKMYQIIGFTIVNNITYPAFLQAYRITNPDAPQTDSYIRLKVNGKPKDCVMILYSDKKYSGGDFFKYLQIGFLSVVGDSIKTIEYKKSKPLIYSFNQVDGFIEQVGKNTSYVISPEEVLADNFAYLILNKKGLPSPQIVKEMKKKLKG